MQVLVLRRALAAKRFSFEPPATSIASPLRSTYRPMVAHWLHRVNLAWHARAAHLADGLKGAPGWWGLSSTEV